MQAEAAEGRAGPGTDRNNQRGEAIAKATAWLRARGTGGETLLALGEAISADPSAWDQRIRRKGEQLVVLFPDGLAGLSATPQAGLDALAGEGLLDVNPLSPLRRVIEVDGRHGAPLTLDASRQVLTLVADDRPKPRAPVAKAPPAPETAALPSHGRNPEPAVPTASPSYRPDPPPADPDPARTLVERIRARDPSLPGGVSRADGWLSVNREAVRVWAKNRGVQPYVLIRTLGHLPRCRVTPDGGLAVRETR